MFLPCPHCGILIEIMAVNCGVFRCGVYRDTGQQIHPHSPVPIDPLLIWGCSYPFKLVQGQLVVCGWNE